MLYIDNNSDENLNINELINSINNELGIDNNELGIDNNELGIDNNELGIDNNELGIDKKIIQKSNIYNSTDNIIISTFINRNFFIKLSESVNKMISFHNQCKDYYYIFKFPNTNYIKRYDGKYIKNLLLKSQNIFKLNIIDSLYYIYYKNYKFYMEIINSYGIAKEHYNSVKDYYINIKPPKEIYNELEYKSKTYSSVEILELFKYANSKLNNKLYNNLQIPNIIQKYNKFINN